MPSLRPQVSLATLLILVGSIAIAQQQPPVPNQIDEQPAARSQPATPGQDQDQHGQAGDRFLAQALLIANQEEIGMAKIALQHSQNEQVKQFAQKMIDDHILAVQQLGKYLGADRSVAQGARASDQPTPRTAAPRDPAVARQQAADTPQSQRTAARESGGLDFIAFRQEVANKNLATAQKQWTEKQGQEAEQCFVMGQVFMHQLMLNGLEVMQRHASPQLQEIIDDSISTTTQHLQQAEQLAKQLASANDADSRPARNDAASDRPASNR